MIEPDKELLADWLEGKLEGDELTEMEAWAAEHAGDLDNEFKCDIGWDALNDDMLFSIPAAEEPPYPEFFNSKLKQAILADGEVDDLAVEETQSESSVPLWKKVQTVLLPASLAAAVAFYIGTQMKEGAVAEGAGNEVIVEVIYIPDENVEAEISDTVDATEIILEGLSPIADDFDMNMSSVSPSKSSMTVHQSETEKAFY